jgi:hypothetical protein
LPAGLEVAPSVHTDLRTSGKVSILALVVEDYKSMNIRFCRGECKQKKTKKCKKKRPLRVAKPCLGVTIPAARPARGSSPSAAFYRRQTRPAQGGRAHHALNC